MKLSMEWLSEFVDVSDIDIKDYCDRMTDTGSKVEGYETLAEEIVNVVVGRIVSVEKHPDADKLRICKTDIGGETLQIVTAAENVFDGAVVPVCKAPGTLPNGVKIKSGKLRGVESQGMFCSIEELELTLHEIPYAAENGILILNDNEKYNLGDDIRNVLKLRDTVVEFEITPNRPDCLAVIGLARETSASFNKPAVYHIPTVKESGGDVNDYLKVEITAPDKCFRYTARVVKNVKIEPSPLWMRMRLHSAGIRPINNIVDITNYVMLEYGQPMHAFDYICIDGNSINVRNATLNENFTSLDDIGHVLSEGMLVIADDKKAIALAGVMGGANSEIKDTTSTVVFESANFFGSSVRVTAKALGMRTESSARFEKGLDPENTYLALERACELVELLGAGEVVTGIVDVYPGKKETTVLKLDAEKINRFLGSDLTEDYMKNVLLSLDFKLDGNDITVPSYRQDVECMNDIAEEVIRIYGYNAIKSTRFNSSAKTGGFVPHMAYKKRMTNLLCSLGLNEIYTFSFISPRWYDKINIPQDDIRRKSVVISNPLGEDTSVMRTTLLPSMLEVLAHNSNHHNDDVAIFETSNIYIQDEDITKLPDEHQETVIGMYGNFDFYDLKGICDAVIEDAGIKGIKYAAVLDNPSFHPGRCAVILSSKGDILGILGEIHPLAAQNYGFDKSIYAAVIEFETIYKLSEFEKIYKPLPKYPAVTRDFAFVCDDVIESGAISDIMYKAGGKIIEEVKLFDMYKGGQIPSGMKSLAFTVSMRASDRTLTDEEADKTVVKILADLNTQLGIKLRS